MRILSLALGLLATGCATTITGVLQDTSGAAVYSQEARVNISPLLTNDSSATSQMLTVSEDGSFSSADVEPGSYLVEALVPGFAPSSQTVQVQSDQHLTLKLRSLKKIQSGTISTGDDVEFSRGSGGADLMPPNL